MPADDAPSILQLILTDTREIKTRLDTLANNYAGMDEWRRGADREILSLRAASSEHDEKLQSHDGRIQSLEARQQRVDSTRHIVVQNWVLVVSALFILTSPILGAIAAKLIG